MSQIQACTQARPDPAARPHLPASRGQLPQRPEQPGARCPSSANASPASRATAPSTAPSAAPSAAPDPAPGASTASPAASVPAPAASAPAGTAASDAAPPAHTAIAPTGIAMPLEGGSLDYNFTVPATPAAVTAARRTVVDSLAVWGLPPGSEVVHTLRLAVSELVTNAVQHTGHVTPHITVTLQADARRRLRIGVTDRHRDRPRIRLATSDATRGRGLALVRSLLLELRGHLTTQRHPDGTKTVWIHVPPAAG